MQELDGKQYMVNAQGHLVPLDRVDEIDRLRDEMVMEIVQRARALSGRLAGEKSGMLDDIAAFIALSAEKYGAKIGGGKGNVTLTSYDGKYKIQRAMQDRIIFDERLQAARELINDCLRDWTEGASDNLRAIIDAAWEVDKEGNVSTSRIMGLRRIKVDDERWYRAMAALMDSIQVLYSKSFVRVYERTAHDEWRIIPLDIAKA